MNFQYDIITSLVHEIQHSNWGGGGGGEGQKK